MAGRDEELWLRLFVRHRRHRYRRCVPPQLRQIDRQEAVRNRIFLPTLNLAARRGLTRKSVSSAGHGSSVGSYEYLVFRSTLVGVALKHGFKPIIRYDDPRLEEMFQKVGLARRHLSPFP